MGLFPVSPAKEKDLLDRMERMGVRPSEVTERFIRSSGPGGQKVNKAATCVVLHHLPTGLIVRCQQERTQGLNRFLAWRRLLEKIEARQKGVQLEEQARIAKIRRQKQRRSRRARERMLEAKRLRGEKKALRAPVAPERNAWE
jgi:protein subunit release factor B